MLLMVYYSSKLNETARSFNKTSMCLQKILLENAPLAQKDKMTPTTWVIFYIPYNLHQKEIPTTTK